MSTGSFEAWAKEEIARLRSEADVLERTLLRFQNGKGQTDGAKQAPNGHSREDMFSGREPRRSKRSKYDPLLAIWKQAGHQGMTIDALYDAAQRLGIKVQRASLRSMIWVRKEQGRARAEGDRYIWVHQQGQEGPHA